MIFVEDSHDHLETGLFLYGQDFLDAAYDNLEATGFQFLVGLTEDDVQLHVGSRSYAVDDKHHLVASLRLELLAKQIYHLGSRIVGRNKRFLSATAFAVLSHTDLHDALGQVGDRTAVLRMRTRAHGNGQSSDVVVIAFGDFDQLVKRLAFFGCST